MVLTKPSLKVSALIMIYMYIFIFISHYYSIVATLIISGISMIVGCCLHLALPLPSKKCLPCTIMIGMCGGLEGCPSLENSHLVASYVW